MVEFKEMSQIKLRRLMSKVRTLRIGDDLWEAIDKEAIRRSRLYQMVVTRSDVMRSVLVKDLVEQHQTEEQVKAMDEILGARMNKEDFEELTGEDPEDVLGPDFQNEPDEMEEDEDPNEEANKLWEQR